MLAGAEVHPAAAPQAASPSVQQRGQPLPTFDQFQERVSENRRVTVGNVWGLMLQAVPGGGGQAAPLHLPCLSVSMCAAALASLA